MTNLLNFLVWLDPQVQEVLAVEKKHATTCLIEKIKEENVSMTVLQAHSTKEAINLWLGNLSLRIEV